MNILKKTALLAAAAVLLPRGGQAFCGFYVAPETEIHNKTSKVVLARDGDLTAITMVNDFQGDLSEFAMVIPVPVAIRRDQVAVLDSAVVERLFAETAPSLVEIFDHNPCDPPDRIRATSSAEAPGANASRGVTVEAAYTVGEYDIAVLSAEQSDGLEAWLLENGYNIPEGASAVLNSYIRQNVRFFVAKVNLAEQAALGFSYLRPLQVSFESPKFMLPIRLGTVNAAGPQDLTIVALTRSGRVESTNYRAVRMPEAGKGGVLPACVLDNPGEFYEAVFDRQVEAHGMSVLFLETAWNMNSFYMPGMGVHMSSAQLRELGCSWLEPNPNEEANFHEGGPTADKEAFATRLRLRYTADTFPEDLFFQETGDAMNHRTTYRVRHHWQGDDWCEAATAYRKNLKKRTEEEAKTLAKLTGWDMDEVRERVGLNDWSDPVEPDPPAPPSLIERIFGK